MFCFFPVSFFNIIKYLLECGLCTEQMCIYLRTYFLAFFESPLISVIRKSAGSAANVPTFPEIKLCHFCCCCRDWFFVSSLSTVVPLTLCQRCPEIKLKKETHFSCGYVSVYVRVSFCSDTFEPLNFGSQNYVKNWNRSLAPSTETLTCCSWR